jgi:hypothetical protein
MCEPRGNQAVAFTRQLTDLKICYGSLLRVSFAAPWLWCITSIGRLMTRLRSSLLKHKSSEFGFLSIIPFKTELAFFLYGAIACCLSIVDIIAYIVASVLEWRSPVEIGVFGDCDYRRVDYMADAFNGQREVAKTFVVPRAQVFLIFAATWFPCVLIIGSVIIYLVERPYLLVYIPIIVGLQLRLRLSLLVESAKACLLLVQADNSVVDKMRTIDRSYGSLIDRCVEELQKSKENDEEDLSSDSDESKDEGAMMAEYQGDQHDTENDEEQEQGLDEIAM